VPPQSPGRTGGHQLLAINYLKRFVADYERESGQRLELFKAPETGRRLAVVGGGAEGLTAACFLARLGHSPTIFEAMPKLGGLLRTVIVIRPPSLRPCPSWVACFAP
jgi:NADPH-dependent glutamate synthase beta subunit-like oxidoreductase